MAETNLDAFKGKDTAIVADWLKSKGLHKLCSVFEGIMHLSMLSPRVEGGGGGGRLGYLREIDSESLPLGRDFDM